MKYDIYIAVTMPPIPPVPGVLMGSIAYSLNKGLYHI